MLSSLTIFKLKFELFLLRKKARNTFPEDLPNLNLWSQSTGLKVAVIDNDGFDFKTHLESIGVSVTVFHDYFKPVSQRQEKRKPYAFGQYDIVLCDINDIASGNDGFGELQGVGAIEALRYNFPFKMIIAYTGNPAALSKRIKKEKNSNLVDKIYDKQWEREDFMETFKESCKSFSNPGARWQFIRNRLTYLGAKEKEIDKIREAFVFSCLVKANPKFLVRADAELQALARSTLSQLQQGSMSDALRSGLSGLGLISDVFGIAGALQGA